MGTSEELTFTRDKLAGRLSEAALWFVLAACIIAITLLPLGSKQDPYPWGACAVAWAVAAGLGGLGVLGLNTRHGVTIHRDRGTAVVWFARFRQRRERVHSLDGVDTLHVTTWLSRSWRSGRIRRWYDLELRGPGRSLPLSEIPPTECQEAIPVLARFLRLRVEVLDRHPDGRL